MRKILLAFTLYLFPIFFLNAQKLHVNLFGGFSNYQGDLQKPGFNFSQAKFAFGAGAAYEITEKLYVRLNAVYGKVSGDDKINKANAKRRGRDAVL